MTERGDGTHEVEAPTTGRRLTQWAPWPQPLEELVAELDYNEAWEVSLLEDYDRDFAPADHGREAAIAGGTTLLIVITHRNSYPPHDLRRTGFSFPVPPCTFDRENWTLWLFDRISEVERHERMEHFRFNRKAPDGGGWVLRDGTHVDELVERPLAPLHGPGNDPNRIHLWAPDERRRTSFRGIIKPDGEGGGVPSVAAGEPRQGEGVGRGEESG